MVTCLRAESFKSWQDTGPLELAPLTGLFGTNSSGKSSILQMLLLMKQTVESPDRKRVLHTGDDRSPVDLGSFFDLIHGHKTDEALGLSFSWKLPEALVVHDPRKDTKILFRADEITFRTRIRAEGERPVVECFDYRFGTHRFGMARRAAEHEKDRYDLDTGAMVGRRPRRGRPAILPPPVKCYGFPDEAVGYFANIGFLPDFVLALEALFSRVLYLGPLRQSPKRSYAWAGERPTDVGRAGEDAAAALLAAQAERLMHTREVAGRQVRKPIEYWIAQWMRDAHLVDSFSLRPIAPRRRDYEVRVRTTPTSPEVLITDVGFGVSQLLPVVVLCYYAPPGSVLLLEQPEIHLHPLAQSALADVFVDVVKNRDVQIIVESHSEHLLRRLQRRIAEEQISASDAALYFCRMEGSTSKAERLDVDEFGNITNWPDNFFGDEMAELFAMTDAAMRRQEALVG